MVDRRVVYEAGISGEKLDGGRRPDVIRLRERVAISEQKRQSKQGR
jgi:hypothetical protein